MVNAAEFVPKPPDDWARALKPMALAGAAKEGALEGAKAVALPGANTPATEGEPTPEVCLNAGVLTPSTEVCPNAGALTPIPEVCTNAVREPLVGVAGAPNAHPDADGTVPNNADPQPLAGTPEFWYAFDVFAAKFWVKLDDADGAPRELNAGAPPIAGAIASSAKSGPDAVPADAATTSPPIMARTSAPEGAAAGTPPANRPKWRVPSGASQVGPPAALVAGVLDDAVSSVRARITSSKRESPGAFPFESFAAFSASLPFFVFAVLSAPALRSARTISP